MNDLSAEDVKAADLYEKTQNAAVSKNIRMQLKDPERRKTDHIKLSLIWGTTQNIRKIQAELANGYSFDVAKLNDLVRAMMDFINSVVDPSVTPQSASEVKVEEIQ
jgi:hypothetical protein